VLDTFRQFGKEALESLKSVTNPAELEEFRIRFLARKGAVTDMLSKIGSFPAEQKREAGALANKIKQEVTEAFEKVKASLGSQTVQKGPLVDVTLPGIDFQLGKPHIISQTISELIEIFGRMGFGVAYGPEVEDEWHNFVALNIPQGHPARDPSDNFCLDFGRLLRSQTSTIQIRTMEKQKPPIRVVAPGRVYRPDTVDATHMFMFHQLEALVVDEGV